MNDEMMDKNHAAADRFEDIFHRLLAGEAIDLYGKGVSSLFEAMATKLLAEVPERKSVWYDGIDGLAVRIRKSHQVEFRGEVWVGDHQRQWKEDFQAMVTDKHEKQQGIWIILSVGSDKAEGELSTAFGLA